MSCLLRPSPTVSASIVATRRVNRRRETNLLLIRCARGPTAGGGEKSGRDDVQTTLRFLNSGGARRAPRKSLGQHYMINSSINEKLSSIAEVEDGDVVLEIGPGTGSLTNTLINAGATVIAVEKDPRMASIILERFEGTDRLMVLQEDLTKCRVSSHVTRLLESKRSQDGLIKYAKVVANVPFNISTEIVKQILPLGDIFSDVVLLLQHETALRLADSQLRSSEYRAINIFVNFFSDAEYIFKVDRKNFFPEPNVDGAVVKFKLRQPADYPAVGSVKDFFSMVNSAFNGKRKMLRKSLQHLRKPNEIEEALSFAGLPVTARPEELSLNDFVRLHNSLRSTTQQ